MINKVGNRNINQTMKTKPSTQTIQKGNKSFNSILNNQINNEKLIFSKHANIKMQSLGIKGNDELNIKLENAVEKANNKNIKESLILSENYGFITSIQNKTVITVIDLNEMNDNVFTNIDGAVII